MRELWKKEAVMLNIEGVGRWWWQHGKPKYLKEGVLSVCYIKYELLIMVLASSILVLHLITPIRELGSKKRRSCGRRRC